MSEFGVARDEEALHEVAIYVDFRMASAAIEHLPDSLKLLEAIDAIRVEAASRLNRSRQAELGQYFTPIRVARLMSSMSKRQDGHVRLLDPGAGVGVLAAAWIVNACDAANPPSRIDLTAYELDPALIPSLTEVLDRCQRHCAQRGVQLAIDVRCEDFILSGARALNGGFFGTAWPAFDAAILNPPYMKLPGDSPARRMVRDLGVETGNLYTAFVAMALRSLDTGGELIAITPRSFCNGPYFTAFRKDLLRLSSLTLLHTFDSRDTAFGEDEVLQENVIFRAERGVSQAPTVTVEWSEAGGADHVTRRELPFNQVVQPGDADAFIHIAAGEWDSRVAGMMRDLPGKLELLGLQVSTGRVVDFRAAEFLRDVPDPDTVPLIYPGHFSNGAIAWPKEDSKKPNALCRTEETEGQLNPMGTYVLVKRFSSKEEPRRVVACVFSPDAAPGEFVAFENHLNYFHCRGRGIPRRLAWGLSAYLNSTLVDTYVRQFNGHTQVNATDLRKLPYPSVEQLERIAERVDGDMSSQSALDDIVEGELLTMARDTRGSKVAERRIAEAIVVLQSIGLPKEQTNERAALTILALLDLSPKQAWSEAGNPLRGVTPVMDFAAREYGKHWKPNTRETVRRSTLHQFQDAGLVVANPDRPDRPVNSPAYCYQVPPHALMLMRAFGTPSWKRRLMRYLATAPSLAARYANEREMTQIPLRMREGHDISLSPGGQNALIARIVEEFCPRFVPGAQALYVGDADMKFRYFDAAAFKKLNVVVEAHGKMPDVVVHFDAKNWLVVIEAVTSHGPVNAKRRGELKKLFASSTAPLVFVTAFLSRKAMLRHLSEIAWETEVWAADAPSHMIHFNGERFLGPYE